MLRARDFPSLVARPRARGNDHRHHRGREDMVACQRSSRSWSTFCPVGSAQSRSERQRGSIPRRPRRNKYP
eukprot:6539597-Pyramimonas_sp.AAC.1